MNIEEFRNFCLSKKGTEESLPFDENTLVFKVGGKIFALINVDSFEFVNLKCNPERSLELRERYEGVKPSYHMNKKHWNSVYFSSDVTDSQLFELINHSYELIVNALPRKIVDNLLKN